MPHPTRSTGLLGALTLALSLHACAAPEPNYGAPLPPGMDALILLPPGMPRPDVRTEWSARSRILPALDNSLEWSAKPSAKTHFPVAGITHERLVQSLMRFRDLLVTSPSSDAFARSFDEEFDVYVSAGWDGRAGGVLFTAYCSPVLDGSLTSDANYRFPLFGLPDDLVKGPDGAILGRKVGTTVEPYPTRAQIESGRLLDGRGLELVWLRDPMDAYLAHVNGSVLINLREGGSMNLGYAGTNGRDYRSLRDALVGAGALNASTANLSAIRAWAARTDAETVRRALWANERFVFFTPISGEPRGSLNVPVTARRSLATDKSIFPRGALVFVDTRLPTAEGRSAPFRQILLDQDTGGAIRSAGRADIYLGVGEDAETVAGAMAAPGQLYYFFLRERR